VPCSLKFCFKASTRFTCIKGKEFYQNDILDFGEEYRSVKEIDGTYRSVFGPIFDHAGVIYANCNKNVSIALTRLTSEVKPEIHGLHAALFCAQALFIPTLDDLRTRLSHAISVYTLVFKDMVEEAFDHVHDPHPKKEIRIRSLLELSYTNEIAHDIWMYVTQGKIKKDEYGKPGKKPRLINDLTCPASLQGAFFTSLMKKAMAAFVYDLPCGVATFISKPDYATLKIQFNNMIDNTLPIRMIYFSDDSCIAVNTDGVNRLYNMDIFCCDATHGIEAFKFLQSLFPDDRHGDIIRRLIKQLTTDLVIKSSNFHKDRKKVVLRPKEPVLYSGTTLTTFVNNDANLFIFCSLEQAAREGRKLTKEEIIACAARAGYGITLEPCINVQKLQFLKNSPMLNQHGEYVPVLNQGVLVRSFGRCKGDIPGPSKESYESRARMFNGALLKGMYPYTHFNLLDSLRIGTLAPTKKIEQHALKHLPYEHSVEQRPIDYISDDQLCLRYDLSLVDIQELNTYASYGTGSRVRVHASNQMLLIDYGLDIDLSFHLHGK
jgi:hypothetical protein